MKRYSDIDNAAYELLSSSSEIGALLTFIEQEIGCECMRKHLYEINLLNKKTRFVSAISKFEMLMHKKNHG